MPRLSVILKIGYMTDCFRRRKKTVLSDTISKEVFYTGAVFSSGLKSCREYTYAFLNELCLRTKINPQKSGYDRINEIDSNFLLCLIGEPRTLAECLSYILQI